MVKKSRMGHGGIRRTGLRRGLPGWSLAKKFAFIESVKEQVPNTVMEVRPLSVVIQDPDGIAVAAAHAFRSGYTTRVAKDGALIVRFN